MSEENFIIRLKLGNPPSEQEFTHQEALQYISKQIDGAYYSAAASFAAQIARALPNDLGSRMLAAQAYTLNREPNKAIEFVEQAESLTDNIVPLLLLRSRISLHNGELEAAERLILKALELEPDYEVATIELGELYAFKGENEKAREVFSALIAKNPRNTSALLKFSELPGATLEPDLIKRIEFIIQSNQLTPSIRHHVHFALAYIYRNLGQIENQFLNLNKANALTAQQYPFDSRAHTRAIDDIISVFDQDFFNRSLSKNGHNDKLLFIVGMPRSGSSLVEQILCAHSKVSDGGESNSLIEAINRYANKHGEMKGFPSIMESIDTENLYEIAERYKENIASLYNTDFIVDKTLGNFKYIGLLHLIFENARFIHVKRNPIATCYGCYERLFTQGSVTYTYDLNQLAEVYEAYDKLMTHWDKVLPGRVLKIDYEDLIEDQEAVTRKILEHCKLDWEDNCLNFHSNSNIVLTSSRAQVKQKIYKESLNRWEKYSDHLQPIMHLLNGASN